MVMKYSLIIPVHNAEKTLSQAINSALKQTRKFTEIILIENNSSDKSDEICQIYAAKETTVQYYRSNQVGVSAARNIGIEKATGDYLFFLDADDIMRENLLFTIDEMIEKTNAKAALYEFNFMHHFSTNKSKKNSFILEEGFYKAKDYLKKEVMLFQDETKFMVWKYAYHKSLFINKNNIFDETLVLYEDIVFMNKLLILDIEIYVLNDMSLLDYLYNVNSATQSNQEFFLKNSLKVYEKLTGSFLISSGYFFRLLAKTLSLKNYLLCLEKIGEKNKMINLLSYIKYKTLILGSKIKRKWMN